MARISVEAVAAIEEKLDASNGGKWERLVLELQDDSRFLLVTVELDKAKTKLEVQEICEVVRNNVATKIPSRDDDYSWMCVVMHQGSVVASTMGGWSSTVK